MLVVATRIVARSARIESMCDALDLLFDGLVTVNPGGEFECRHNASCTHAVHQFMTGGNGGDHFIDLTFDIRSQGVDMGSQASFLQQIDACRNIRREGYITAHNYKIQICDCFHSASVAQVTNGTPCLLPRPTPRPEGAQRLIGSQRGTAKQRD